MASRLGALTLAAGLAACAAGRPLPPDVPPPQPMTEEGPRNEDQERPASEPPSAPPPAYGHRVATQGIPLEPSGRLASNPPDAPAAGSTDEPACVVFWPEARYRNYAYDHIVHLLSRCNVRVFCAVWSDLNPKVVQLELRPEEQLEVLSFRGSPAREFKPEVDCRFVE